MERVGHRAHRWRYGVLAVEVLLASGSLYFGWNAMAPKAVVPQVRVQHSAAAPPKAFGALSVPTAGGASLHLTANPKRAIQAPNLNADWLSRLNADDYDMYRGQWQTLQLLVSGVRLYLEQRVVPRLLGQ